VSPRGEARLAEQNLKATTIKCNSRITVDKPELTRGKRAIVIEDGPTLTHGGMTCRAGYFTAKSAAAAEIFLELGGEPAEWWLLDRTPEGALVFGLGLPAGQGGSGTHQVLGHRGAHRDPSPSCRGFS
jgi:hypothetical protein